jgi:hypothetical protein
MRVYSVTFNSYTNASNNTVSNNSKEPGAEKYITVGKEPFLVTEDQIETMCQYGGGIKTLIFVGNLYQLEPH